MLTAQERAILYAIPWVLALDEAAQEVGIDPTLAYKWSCENPAFDEAIVRLQAICPVDKSWYWHILHRLKLLVKGEGRLELERGRHGQ